MLHRDVVDDTSAGLPVTEEAAAPAADAPLLSTLDLDGIREGGEDTNG